MAVQSIIDRRLAGKNKSIGNRERFLRRYKGQIREAVKRAVDGRGIRDIERGEDIRIPKKDIHEPVFGHGNGGVREIVLEKGAGAEALSAMLFVSYNIQFGCGRDKKIDLARIARTVAAADVILLQEVERHWRPPNGDQAEQLARLLPGYRWVHAPSIDLDGSSVAADGTVDNGRRQLGVMILSRTPILSTRATSPGRPSGPCAARHAAPGRRSAPPRPRRSR